MKNSQINQSLHCSNLNYNLSTDPPTQNMHRHFWVQLTSNSNSTRIRSPSLPKNVFAAVAETLCLCNEVSRIWVVIDLRTDHIPNDEIQNQSRFALQQPKPKLPIDPPTQNVHRRLLNHELSNDPPTQTCTDIFWVLDIKTPTAPESDPQVYRKVSAIADMLHTFCCAKCGLRSCLFWTRIFWL